MTKKLVVALVAALAFARPAAAADLKYTMHMEVRPQANAPSDPMSAMAGGMIGQMFPPGGVDQVVVAGDKGMRSEQKQDFGPVKAGAVTLIKPDGSQYIMDPTAKTYYKVPAVPPEMAAMMAQMSPKVTVGKRGIFETIDGLKCEHITLTMTMGLPGIDPSQLPPGMPTEIKMLYDVWATDAVKPPPAAAAMATSMLKQFGFDQLPELKTLMTDGRMLVKGVMAMFGQELVMTSKDIKTEAADAALFEIPKDYKEVPPPGIGGQPLDVR